MASVGGPQSMNTPSLSRATLLRRAAALTTLAAVPAVTAVTAACGAASGTAPVTRTKDPIKLSLSTDWTTGIREQTVKRWTVEFPKVNPNVREVEIWTAPSEG